jgi:EAL domain-containing protein (putative c-di-GMP-specific phosphodiesterase class I)
VAFTPQLRDRASRSLQLETALRRAIERRELRLAYQPIVSLADVRLVSFEALARWEHPELGVVEPVEFIRVAEETGLIVALGDWVLNEACAQMQRWHESFPNWRALNVSVNVSAKQLQDPRFTAGVRETLARSGLSGEHVRIEITESVLMHDPVEAAAILRELRDLGIRLDMDDFGTGYSSLAYLHQFPLDALKIDRSFVSGPGSAVAYPEIVKTVIELARQLGLEVVAEGVETDEQERELLALGCTYGQGYHFARPLDAPAAERYLDATQKLGGALAGPRPASPLAILPGGRPPRRPPRRAKLVKV